MQVNDDPYFLLRLKKLSDENLRPYVYNVCKKIVLVEKNDS